MRPLQRNLEFPLMTCSVCLSLYALFIFLKMTPVKAGYPPKDLSSLPGVLSELGVKDGDQILVTLKTVTGTISTAQETTKPLASSSTSPSALPTRPEIVKLKSGGYLVVRVCCISVSIKTWMQSHC